MLKLNIKKYDFAVKKVKYLGFIVTVERGISVDPEKTEAIKNWEQDFIDDFASLSALLQRHTKNKLSGKGKSD